MTVGYNHDNATRNPNSTNRNEIVKAFLGSTSLVKLHASKDIDATEDSLIGRFDGSFGGREAAHLHGEIRF